jgi:gamma-glutamyl-gamma-aminobutyrate hydrolase PuuD
LCYNTYLLVLGRFSTKELTEENYGSHWCIITSLEGCFAAKTTHVWGMEDDVQAVLQTGALPLIIPSILQSKEQAEEILSRVDGLLLTGGGDVDGKFLWTA